MIARVIGTACGAILGAMIGSGTGIVGGPFGAVAGASIFTIGGAIWGFSAGPDIVGQFRKWRSRKGQHDESGKIPK